MDTYHYCSEIQRDQTFLHGKLLVRLSRSFLDDPVKISEIFDHGGNPFDPPSCYSCAV